MSKFRLILILIASLLALGVGAVFAGDVVGSADHFPEGVTVAGVDVSGLSRDQAVRRVWSALEPRAMRPVRVRVAGRWHVLRPDDARLRFRLPDAIRRAHEASRPGSPFEALRRELTGARVAHVEHARPTVSRGAVREFVARIGERVRRPPVDAALSLSVEAVTVTPARTGRRLAAADRLQREVVEALLDPRSNRRVRARVEAVPPEISRDELLEASPVIVTVSREARRARVFEQGRLVTSYRVAVGQPGHETPTGRFAVQGMQVNPPWHAPQSKWAGELAGKTIPPGDPRNPILARWIGFNGAVGFHGTKSVDSLGRAASRGCVRMSKVDVVDLYRRVDVGTPVLVGP